MQNLIIYFTNTTCVFFVAMHYLFLNLCNNLMLCIMARVFSNTVIMQSLLHALYVISYTRYCIQ